MPFAHLINAIFGTQITTTGWQRHGRVSGDRADDPGHDRCLPGWWNKLILRKHLVNQDPIILFMATIGLAYFMEGLGDIMWGANIKPLDVGMPLRRLVLVGGRHP